MFKKILIANRGEIACRVIKTAKRLGIKTVAVYSDADKDALHVFHADEAVRLGPAPSNQSYLVQDAILQVIKDTGADAVHPGYGFLSENAGFAQALDDAGVAFIGPGIRAIEAMGDKIESKKLAMAANVSTVPGHAEAMADGKAALEIARKIGFPVMLKASAGGGGKGMRIARSEEEVVEGFDAAVREAKSSFGDDRVFVEKFIEDPRHIEIQIIADKHGNTVYLGERECSIQRRHQKVIEEAPSPFLDEATRKAMGEQAVMLSKAVDYESAGTVEFIVDKDKNFYFLEMNTRLQVEHPVTEYITGMDLVEQMIRVAAGEKLAFVQGDIKLNGWAMESRVYAEDPLRGFLPSIGRLTRYQAPEESDTVRVDTGVYEGGEISIHYDPMIAKLVTYGPDRDSAITAMQSALDAYYIRGVAHNIPFLSALMAHPRFIEGNLTTNFIAEEYPDGFSLSDVSTNDLHMQASVAACMHRTHQERAAATSGRMPGHERTIPDEWVAVLNDRHMPLNITRAVGGFDVEFTDGERREVRTAWRMGEAMFDASIDGDVTTVQVERLNVGYRVSHGGTQADVLMLSPRVSDLYTLMPEKVAADTSKQLLSPMPGLLLKVSVEAGQDVRAGDELAIIEAMKMENVMRAERDGTIKAVYNDVGDTLVVDQMILEFD